MQWDEVEQLENDSSPRKPPTCLALLFEGKEGNACEHIPVYLGLKCGGLWDGMGAGFFGEYLGWLWCWHLSFFSAPSAAMRCGMQQSRTDEETPPLNRTSFETKPNSCTVGWAAASFLVGKGGKWGGRKKVRWLPVTRVMAVRPPSNEASGRRRKPAASSEDCNTVVYRPEGIIPLSHNSNRFFLGGGVIGGEWVCRIPRERRRKTVIERGRAPREIRSGKRPDNHTYSGAVSPRR